MPRYNYGDTFQSKKIIVPPQDLFREYVRRCLRGNDISVRHIAKKLNCSPQNVYKQFNRPLDKWTMEDVYRVADIAKCDKTELINYFVISVKLWREYKKECNKNGIVLK